MSTAIEDELPALVDGAFDAAVDVRRALHAQPELSHAEWATTALVAEGLRTLGLREVECPTDTGAVFVLEGARPGSTVLLRADIDALPVHEEVDVAFRSRVDGVMHACGHDAHAAILLGVAAVLASRADALPGQYAFLFQPAEETLDGAAGMIAGGVLERLRPDRVLGLHVASLLPTGLVAARPGIAMSIAQRVDVHIRGSGGHGALSSNDGNALLAAAALAGRLGESVAGLEYADVPCVCNPGMIRAGTAVNVVPRHADVNGTLRTFDQVQHATATSALRRLCDEVAEVWGVRVDLDLPPPVPAVVNDAAATARWRAVTGRVLGADQVIEMPPATPSDDVSEFLRRVPGCFYFVGAAPGPHMPPVHHAPDFAIDEESLRVGMLTLAAAAVDFAEPDQTA